MAEIETQECNECGTDDWTKFLEQERDDPSEVVKHAFECDGCGAHGRVFTSGGSPHQYSGAMR